MLQEASLGDAEMARQRLEMLANLPRLRLTEDVGMLAQKLILAGLVPEKASSDEVHIAVASVHLMEYVIQT
jgi:hypothetical protein